MWIEIIHCSKDFSALLSLPLRECGLKSTLIPKDTVNDAVTPLAGVWIEILIWLVLIFAIFVTPLAGVWIEIQYSSKNNLSRLPSLPLRECGLKLRIEQFYLNPVSHSPCGSVD